MIERKRQFKTIGFLILLSISLFFPFIQNNLDVSYEDNRDTDFVKTSAQRSVTKQWIKNPTFESPIEPIWHWENGTEGDNSDMDATTSNGQANYDVLGETRTYTGISGVINSSTSLGWGIFNNSGFLPPHTAVINADGCDVAHHWDETAGGDSQIYNYPSIQFKKNVSLGVDISDYVIKSASLEVIFNASVDPNIDTPNDNYTGGQDEDLYAIGDFATFYVLISDINNDQEYTIAYNRTKYLGQFGDGNPSILTIPDSPMHVFSQEDIITALSSALERDTDHSNFTITLGIDIYSEDNDNSGDHDDWDSLMIKTCNLTFSYEKKIDHSTSVSWSQVGTTLDSASVQVTDAKFFFKYKVNNTWPSSAPLSEIIFYLNDKSYNEGIIKLTNFTTSWQDAKLEGFDVTNLISTDVNITVSIEVFLKDTFELGQGISISIDDVYLNISYIETFPDYGTNLELFLEDEDKTLDPFLDVPIGELINITAKFTNASTGAHIVGANVLLTGDRVLENLTESVLHEHFSTEINSTRDLNMGYNFLTIKAQFLDHETMIVNLRITVRKIKTEIIPVSESNIIITPGGTADIDILINNTDYDGSIRGATVTYTWELGQGEFTDDNNDGIYNVSINNIPAGVYIISITAFSGEDYSFETYQIILTVTIPIDPIWTILLYVLIGGIIGIVSIFTIYQTRLKYPPLVRKVRKLRKKIRKGRKLKQIILENRGEIIERNIKEKQKILGAEIGISEEKKIIKASKLATEPKKTTIDKGGLR